MSILIFGTQPEKIDPAADYDCFSLTARTQSQYAILPGSAVLTIMGRSTEPAKIGFRKIQNG